MAIIHLYNRKLVVTTGIRAGWAMRPSRSLLALLLASTVPVTLSKYPNALRRAHTEANLQKDAPVRVPILVIIFTQASNVARRRWQRQTWLRQRWVRGELAMASTGTEADEPPAVSWRYVYVQARRLGDGSKAGSEVGPLDEVHGDMVTLSTVHESYANLVYKTLEAVRWALRRVAFGTLLKTDDDSIVHIGRAAAWLHHCVRTPEHRALLYAGRVFNDSQIIRANYTKANLLHPEWYPDDFVKWAVPYESYAAQSLYYPPYCSGGGYLLGRKSAQRIVNAYDLRSRASRPVVPVEDAFVGILAEESGMSPTDITDYIQDPPAGRAQDPALFGGRMLVHRVTEPSKAFEWLIYPVRISYDGQSPPRARLFGAKKGVKGVTNNKQKRAGGTAGGRGGLGPVRKGKRRSLTQLHA